MKVRSRRYKNKTEGPSYWPSFVDIMTTVTLVFFFIMIISSGISRMFVDNLAEERMNLYEKIQGNLNESNVDESVISFDRKEGKINIATETFFDSGKWILKGDGIGIAEQLSRIFYALLKDAEIEGNIQYIEVVGHTDYAGNTINNRRLSTERAMSFLNALMPMDSALENEYGHKFKVSGMSEFETNPSKEERDRTDYDVEGSKEQRKIEIRMIFSNKDLEESIISRIEEKFNSIE